MNSNHGSPWSRDKHWASRPEQRYLVHNRTPREIELHSRDGTSLHLSPLGQRVICRSILQPFWDEIWALRHRHHVSLRPYLAPPTPSTTNHVMMTVGSLLILGTLGVGLLGPTDLLPWLIATGVVGAALMVRALMQSARHERARVEGEHHADINEGDVDYGTGSGFYSGYELGRLARKYGVLLVVIVIGVLLPAVAIIAATDAKTFFVFEDGLRIKAGSESQVVARAIQVIYVAILTVFPALMYFQFDRQRAGTIRGQWVRSIFRIDSRMENLSDVNARYGDLMSEASNFRSDASRALGGKHSPLIIATILIGLGWVILVARTESYDFDRTTQATSQATVAETASQRANVFAEEATGITAEDDVAEARRAAAGAVEAAQTAQAAAFQGSEDPGMVPETQATALPTVEQIEEMDLEEAQETAGRAAAQATAAAEAAGGTEDETASTGTYQLLAPDPGPAAMAFLGAYFFAVYLVLKAYLRGDLRPKVYNQITARLVTVVIVAYLIGVLIPADDRYVVQSLAFVAGVVPNTVLRRLGEVTGGRPLLSSLFGQAFGEDRPLTLIDGVDVYERERLATEGITDIEALAHTDIVANMVNTRIPMERLIDWVDQAVLILHLDEQSEAPDAPWIQLRRHGIRTASAFIAATRSESCEELRTRMQGILEVEDLEPLALVLERELVIRHIQQWNASALGMPGEPPMVMVVASYDSTIEIRYEPAVSVRDPGDSTRTTHRRVGRAHVAPASSRET